ncbi:SPOR domain-containing protein [Sporohalobacter salinus]|uniref:SPOR domain-containing protein n=1 Tax=Sporohalobacter salinus TaxID=1494606 RepID=UPI0019613482|nr:SPOR domain-containing protein [Sporohalobacter salinus]MBM7623065.1 cell division septation protein DedD [Sporohalobacter salinus]
MKFDRPKLKSGFSLAVMVISMSLLAAVVGYFLGNWMIQYVTAPNDNIQNVSSEKVVSEEKINTSELENTESSTVPEEAIQNQSNQNLTQDQPEVKQNSTNNLFVVQVGAFDNHDNAKGLVDKLKAKGYSAYITSQNPYKVQVGAFKKRDKATQLGNKLKKDGFSVYIDQ